MDKEFYLNRMLKIREEQLKVQTEINAKLLKELDYAEEINRRLSLYIEHLEEKINDLNGTKN